MQRSCTSGRRCASVARLGEEANLRWGPTSCWRATGTGNGHPKASHQPMRPVSPSSIAHQLPRRRAAKSLWITLPAVLARFPTRTLCQHSRWWWSSMPSKTGSPSAFSGIGALRSQHVAAPPFMSFRWLVLACYPKPARPSTPNANQPPERPSEAPLAPRMVAPGAFFAFLRMSGASRLKGAREEAATTEVLRNFFFFQNCSFS